MNKKIVTRVMIVCGVFAGILIGLMIYLLSPIPTHDKVTGDTFESFFIEDEMFETQVINECSAFSSAYVIRHFGEVKTGLTLYDEFEFKLPFSGYVLPKGILSYFEKTDYKVNMYTGTIETLKLRLNQGVPIIVLVGDGLNWQHYMTLVGYDEIQDDMYFFDSLCAEDENDNFPGNRTLSTAYFSSMWDNKLPVYHQLYFVFEK